MTGIILAGGKALRMGGTDKAFLEINNEPIINRQLRTLKKIFKEIIIVTNSASNYKSLRRVRTVSDVLPERGPLGGIYAGLLASTSFYNFVIACDMPFLNESLIRYMVKNIHNHDVMIPKIDGKVHPIFGIYSKNCIPAMEKLIEQGELRVLGIFPKVKSRFLLRHEIERFDEHLLSLTNINSKEDYEACLITR